MKSSIYSDYLDKWTQETPDDVWLRDRAGDRITEWTWRQARAEIDAAAAWPRNATAAASRWPCSRATARAPRKFERTLSNV